MNILAVIPARLNSSRVPGKNTMEFRGKPGVALAIEAALASRRKLTIAVVSDDEKALEIAESFNVWGLDEPPALVRCGFALDLLWYGVQNVPGDWDAALLLTPNIPIRPAGLVDRLIDFMDETGCDTVSTLMEVPSHFHPFLLTRRLPDGQLCEHYLHTPMINSQDFPPIYVFTCAGELLKIDALEMLCRSRQEAIRTLDRRGIAYSADEIVEIDSPLDVVWARFLEQIDGAIV